MKRFSSAVLASTVLALGLAACNATTGETGTGDAPAGLVSDLRGSAESCSDPGRDLWVVVEGRGDCIRFYDGGSLGSGTAPDVIVWLHGDLVQGTWRSRAAVPTYRPVSGLAITTDDLDRRAAQRSSAGRIPYVFMGRPGAFGSTGDHRDYRLAREHKLINAALSEMKKRFGVERFHLGGHSGGGHVVASLLPIRPDARCILLSSSVLAVGLRQSLLGITKRTAKLAEYHDPLGTIGLIRPDPKRRFFVVGDPRDTRVSFFSQQTYFDSLQRFGHEAHLLETRSAPPDYHGYGPATERLLIDCARGLPTAQLLARARSR